MLPLIKLQIRFFNYKIINFLEILPTIYKIHKKKPNLYMTDICIRYRKTRETTIVSTSNTMLISSDISTSIKDLVSNLFAWSHISNCKDNIEQLDRIK